jgi:hypothetical protein
MPVFKNTNLTLESTNDSNIYQAKYGEHVECEIEFNPIDIQKNELKIFSSNLEKFQLTFRNNKFIYKKDPIYSTNLIKQRIKIARQPFEEKIFLNHFFGKIKIDTSFLNENDEYACCLEEVLSNQNKVCSYLKFNNKSMNPIMLNSLRIDIEELDQSTLIYSLYPSIFHDYLRHIILLCLVILSLTALVLSYRIKSSRNIRSTLTQQPDLFTISQKRNQNVEYPQQVSNLYSRYNLNNSRDYIVDVDECPPAYHEIKEKRNHDDTI